MAQGAGEVIGLDAAFRQDDGGDDPGRGVIGAEKLARTVAASVRSLVFLEARVPLSPFASLRARAGSTGEDAVLIAGLTELLYGERADAVGSGPNGMMRSNGLEAIADAGVRAARRARRPVLPAAAGHPDRYPADAAL